MGHLEKTLTGCTPSPSVSSLESSVASCRRQFTYADVSNIDAVITFLRYHCAPGAPGGGAAADAAADAAAGKKGSVVDLFDACGRVAPLVLMLRTTEGDILGAFLSHPWSARFVMEEGEFFGNPDCYVWRFRANRSSSGGVSISSSSSSSSSGYSAWHVVYPPAQRGKRTAPANLLFMRGTDSSLTIGGGGHGHAIELGASLDDGFSFSAATFGNEPLAGSGNRFKVESLQVWGFGPDAVTQGESNAAGGSGRGGAGGGRKAAAVTLEKARADYGAAVSKFISGGSDSLWV